MVITLTDVNFKKEVLESEIPVLVDFWAPWCSPCLVVSPLVEEISYEYGGKIKVCKVNVEEAPLTASNYGVMAIPTLIIFHKGKEVGRIVGVVSKGEILEKFKPFIPDKEGGD